MCGRFVLTSAPEAIRDLFAYIEQAEFPPRYNIAPTQPIAVVVRENGARHLKLMRWGLIPAWVKDPRQFGLLINARAESVLEKPSFRNAMQRRRCLIPADGFYEWQEAGGRKRPHFIQPARPGAVAFAGLWETWVGPNGEEIDTVAIVTTAASADLSALHDRMPAVIAPEAFELWLDCARVDATTALAFVATPRRGLFASHEVSTAVNRAAADGPSLIVPASGETPAAQPPTPAPRKPRPKSKPRTDNGQSSLF